MKELFFNKLIILFILFFSSFTYADFDKNLLLKLGLSEEVILSLDKNKTFSLYIDGVYKGELNLIGEETKSEVIDKVSRKYDIDSKSIANLQVMLDNQEVEVFTTNKKNQGLTSGKAFLVNYNFQDSIISGDHQLYGDIDSRMLMNGYALKSVGLLSSVEGEDIDFETKELFFEQKNESGYEYQIGKLRTKNAKYSGIELIGVQFSPIKKNAYFKTLEPIEGYVLSPSDIEVIQDGQVIYRSRLNAGHYEIKDLNLKTASNSIIIRVTEGNGDVTERSYDVVDSIIDTGSSDFSISLGSTKNNPILGLLSYGTRYNNIPFQFGTALGENNMNVGINAITSSIWEGLSLNLFTDLSFNEYKEIGINYGFSASYSYDKFTLSSGHVVYSDYYQIDHEEYPLNYVTDTLSLGYQVSDRTSFNVSATRNVQKNIKSDYSYFLNVNHDFEYVKSGLYINKDEVALRFSIPLNGDYFSSSLSVRDQLITSSSSFSSQMFNNRTSLSAGANVNKNNRYLYTQGTYISDTANFSAGYGINKSQSNDVESYNLGANGSVVLSNKGIDFSSSAGTDNIAIVEFNHNYDEVSVSTEKGIYSPSISGRILVPDLDEYSSNKIMVNSNNLPDNVNVIGGVDYKNPKFGSVSNVKFNFKTSIDGVYQLQFKDGNVVPPFAVVTSSQGKYITIVGPDGLVGFNQSNYTDGNYLLSQAGVNICHFKISDLRSSDNEPDVLTCL